VTAYTPELGDRITALLAEFKLSSAAEQMTKRFVDAGCDQALVTLAEVLEVEAQARRERRVDRLRRSSRLPPAKTFDTLDVTRVPRTVLIQTRELARGHFVDRALAHHAGRTRRRSGVVCRRFALFVQCPTSLFGHVRWMRGGTAFMLARLRAEPGKNETA